MNNHSLHIWKAFSCFRYFNFLPQMPSAYQCFVALTFSFFLQSVYNSDLYTTSSMISVSYIILKCSLILSGHKMPAVLMFNRTCAEYLIDEHWLFTTAMYVYIKEKCAVIVKMVTGMCATFPTFSWISCTPILNTLSAPCIILPQNIPGAAS